MTINVQEEDETRLMARKITSKDIYGHPGSATRCKILALPKAKEDKKQAADDVVAEKRVASTEKRARSTTAFVTAGSEVLKRLEQSSASVPSYSASRSTSSTPSSSMLILYGPILSRTRKQGLRKAAGCRQS